MRIDILTIFPEMVESYFKESIMKHAQKKSLVEIKVHDLRSWTEDKHNTVDSSPYGGGAGMLMRVDVIDRAIEDIKKNNPGKVILLDTKGETFNQKKAVALTKEEGLILIAGRYEGIDHRVHEHVADEVINIGEYVLTGGELPAMIIADAVIRLIPGVLGNNESLTEESFNEEGTQEYPQYTRPEEYKSWRVPEVLLSGNHQLIAEWRKKNQG